jgi:4-diphosphocytidyl-2-C-methyl-D-erythritol kinase
VNLFLHVVGRREDGYHLLDSLAVFAGAADRLSATPAEELSLELRGPFGPGLASDSDNLVLRAARALAEASGVSPAAKLVLEKNLPVASGIGGGSADAAAALRVLQALWGVTVPAREMASLALRLGADVPVCLGGRAARMGGVGEVLQAAPVLPPCGIALVNPGVAGSTPAVFRARQGGFSPHALLPEAWPDAAAMVETLSGLRNDLELPAAILCPQVSESLNALRATDGVLLARMSGSGATCFGLCETPAAARAAAAALARPGWWCWGGGLHGTE